jgi:hypothetical protein
MENLIIGELYSKNTLTEILKEPNLKLVREGIYYCKSSSSALLFADLEKEGKDQRFHFNDFFDGEFFHWDSQTTQHIDSPKIQQIITDRLVPHLFVRIKPKHKSITQPFVYCGRLKYQEHDNNTSKPVHVVYENLDYKDGTANENLLNVYFWKPANATGIKSEYFSPNPRPVTSKRQRTYNPPNETERRGLVTSRVGQGYYRQQILERWNGTCPVTNCSLIEILISSHIVGWSESDNTARIDVDNGILLAPNADALFDKHLISFTDDGEMLISNRMSLETLKSLGVNPSVIIPVFEGMKKYLKHHRDKMHERN